MRVVQCRFRKWLITVLLAFYWVLPAKATFPGVNGRITFARFFPATQSESIFSIKPDGGGEQQLTFDAANHFSEVSDWSPDALRIAFHSDRNSTDSEFVIDIFTMKADGSDVVQLTRHAGQNVAPEYSPSGTTIVFDKEGSPGVEGIYIMNASDGLPSGETSKFEYSTFGSRSNRTSSWPLPLRASMESQVLAVLGSLTQHAQARRRSAAENSSLQGRSHQFRRSPGRGGCA